MGQHYRAPISFGFPLSGDVTQGFDWSGAQFGLFNINLGRSSAPAVEQKVLEEVGSYGRQIGRLADAVEVLMKTLDTTKLSDEDQKALTILKAMQHEIRAIKRRVGKS